MNLYMPTFSVNLRKALVGSSLGSCLVGRHLEGTKGTIDLLFKEEHIYADVDIYINI